jgi:uncharacterized OB-fold protein
MAESTQKFLPLPTPLSQPYWDACRAGQLLVQHCSHCGHYQFYPRTVCTACMRPDPQWVQASGRGTVASWTVVRRPVSEAYAGDCPYVIALIRLDEGPVMMSQLISCDPQQVSSGMCVEAVFQSWSEQVTMPVFAPLAAAGQA